MMDRDSSRPTPPDDLDRNRREALTTLETQDPRQLRAIGTYLEELAEWKESTEKAKTDTGENDLEYPNGVPERASVTVTEVASTTYYYYQWRDGDRIESKTVRR